MSPAMWAPLSCQSSSESRKTQPTGFYMLVWWNGRHVCPRSICHTACRFKSCHQYQIPFTLSVEAMSFTFIPRFNYPELPNNSLRLCRICRNDGIGRHEGLKNPCHHGVWVRVPLSAPNKLTLKGKTLWTIKIMK